MSQVILALIVMGAVMFGLRSLPFIFANRIRLNALAREALELATPSVIAAFLASGLFFDKQSGALNLSWDSPYLIGGFATLLIALKWPNFLVVTFLGYGVFLLAKLYIN